MLLLFVIGSLQKVNANTDHRQIDIDKTHQEIDDLNESIRSDDLPLFMQLYIERLVKLSLHQSRELQQRNEPCSGVDSEREDMTNISFSSFVKNVQDKKFAAVVGYNELYPIGTCVSTDSLWMFNYSTNSCSETDVRSIYGTTVDHEYGDSVSDVESKLIEIINAASTSANSYKKISSNYYQFVSGDYIYGINLGYPSISNPVYRKHISTGESYFLLENLVQSF